MIGRRPTLYPQAALAALPGNKIALGSSDDSDGPVLTVLRSAPTLSPMGREHRLQLQHTIHMILRSQLQRLSTPKSPARQSPHRAAGAPQRCIIELRILRHGHSVERVSRTVAALHWHRDVVRLLPRLTEIKREIVPAPAPPSARPHRLHPPPAPGVPRLPSPWSRPPGEMSRTLWFSTIRGVGDYLLQRAREIGPRPPRSGRNPPHAARPWPLSPNAEAARQATYLVLAVPGQGGQGGPMAIGLSRYQPRQGTVLAYRRAARSSGPEIHQQIQKITRHVQSKVIHDISQNTPWRGELREALRSPDLMRLLTDQISRAIDRRDGIDRYRRGL